MWHRNPSWSGKKHERQNEGHQIHSSKVQRLVSGVVAVRRIFCGDIISSCIDILIQLKKKKVELPTAAPAPIAGKISRDDLQRLFQVDIPDVVVPIKEMPLFFRRAGWAGTVSDQRTVTRIDALLAPTNSDEEIAIAATGPKFIEEASKVVDANGFHL